MSTPMVTYNTFKKGYFYNFDPTKAEEEAATSNSSAPGHPPRIRRMLVEMRDVRLPPTLDPNHPWLIKKTMNCYEVSSGRIAISFNDTFEYILRYWNFCMANHIAILGHKIAVVLWDVTNERNPKRYEGNEVSFEMTSNDNYVLSCIEMMRDRRLRVNDSIGLYWDSRKSIFLIKLFY